MTDRHKFKTFAEWLEAFKKRNGLDQPLPAPPADAPLPPKPHTEADREEEP